MTKALLIACALALVVLGLARAAEEKNVEVTLTGSMLCQRACVPPTWDCSPTGDHSLVLFALDGTPEIKAELARIMKEDWPGDTLDCDQAMKLSRDFDAHLKYFLSPSPLVDSYHREVEYPARPVAVTGTVSERDGKKWITVSKIEPAKLTYPAKMLAPDKPLVPPDPKPLVLKVTDKLELKCVKLPPGRFLRGSPLYEQPRWQDEFPHEVTLTKAFYLSEIPITQAMFEAVVGVNPSKRTPCPYTEPRGAEFNERFRHKQPDEGPDYAVENATWEEIQKFCDELSKRNHVKVRLPTEAEWEYAARVGTSGPCFTEKYLTQRSYLGDTEGRCEPVKRHAPNVWGLYDMVHTGWELVSDHKADNVREKQVDPIGPPRESAADHGTGPLRRTKGGAYYGDTHLNLHGACDEAGNNEEGIMIFRVAVDVPPAP
jgi:formylglycine-generating enzyme required for sulfatase activity